jgi:hypothetical protein
MRHLVASNIQKLKNKQMSLKERRTSNISKWEHHEWYTLNGIKQQQQQQQS